ncbi:MAG: ABC transporter ATP-binding protein [Candidatus Electrothrix sp. MAN1_4]|nr:ABC transporter ATP-binding protein [Candidatus Electrothrix sp. MAN1_4]
MQNRIIVENLGKKYRRYHADRPWTLQEAVLKGMRRIRPMEYLWALRNLNFTIPHGRMVGVIGPSGAGKSTLLQLMGGIGRPDEGRLETCGQIGGLLDLGPGFHTDLTGRENIFVSAVIAGLSRRQVQQRFDSIVAFSELEEFIDSPLRTYSSGMKMRLAFSVSIHVEPEVLLIDEVLSVGDLSFQKKSFKSITDFKKKGCTIVLVTHDHKVVREICDEVLWLNQGRLVAIGAPELVVDQYVAATESGQLSFPEKTEF